MTDDDRYNGWLNRETWAVNLWLSNDEGIYRALRERLGRARKDWALDEDFPPREAGRVVHEYWEEITDLRRFADHVEVIVRMMLDVGSIWRVDWDEVGAAWLEE